MNQLSLFDPTPVQAAPGATWARDPEHPQFDRLAHGSGPLCAEEIAALAVGGWVLVEQGDGWATFSLDGAPETQSDADWREQIDILLIGARHGVVWL